MFPNTITILWTVVLYAILVDGQSEGDRCTTRSAESGVCTKISGCISVINDLRQGKKDHIVCGYDGFVQIVCCPSAQPTISTITRKPISTRISARKCNEYKEFSYSKVSIDTDFGGILEKKVSNCASLIGIGIGIGVNEAKRREFPHMALIGFEDGNTIQWNCGGSLISRQFVLSAAHCFETLDSRPAKYVRLGEHDLNRNDEATTIDLRVIESYIHPQYLYPIHYNDIGLFKLERKVELNGAIRPACLPEQSAIPTKSAIATGWEVIGSEGGDEQSNVLFKVILDIVSQNDCNSTYKGDFNRKLKEGIIEQTQVCAGSSREKERCQRDTAGPLQIYHDTHSCTFTIVGVASFGKYCAATIGTPDVYTRIFAYLDWIESIVWPNQ